MLSWPACTREPARRWPPLPASSPRSGNLRARPEISKKNKLCFLVADGLLLCPPPGGGASEPTVETPEGINDVFQISHCHIATPSPGDQVLTKDGDRVLLQNIRIMDATRSFTAVVREKAALALPGLASKDVFAEAHATDNISFPVLASAFGKAETSQWERCFRACLAERSAGGSRGPEY